MEKERQTERARGGREIRLTQRENENEGRDVSTIDHRGSECNANHAPFARTHPLTPAAAPTPDAAHPSRRRFSLLPLSHPSAPPPSWDTSVPAVTQSRQDIDSDTLATYKQPKGSRSCDSVDRQSSRNS